MTEAIDYATHLASATQSSGDPIDKFLADSERFFFSTTFRAMTEIMIASRADRTLAREVGPIVRNARDVLNSIWRNTLHEAGHSYQSAERFVDLTQYFLRGLLFANIWLPFKPDRAAMIAAWRAIAPAVLALDHYNGSSRAERKTGSLRSPRKKRRPVPK